MIEFIENSDGEHTLKGFEGVMCHREPPGVYVPVELMAVFKPKSAVAHATRAYVERIDDPDKSFVANVSRVGSGQLIVNAPIRNYIADPRFPADTRCFVRVATAQDELDAW